MTATLQDLHDYLQAMLAAATWRALKHSFPDLFADEGDSPPEVALPVDDIEATLPLPLDADVQLNTLYLTTLVSALSMMALDQSAAAWWSFYSRHRDRLKVYYTPPCQSAAGECHTDFEKALSFAVSNMVVKYFKSTRTATDFMEAVLKMDVDITPRGLHFDPSSVEETLPLRQLLAEALQQQA